MKYSILILFSFISLNVSAQWADASGMGRPTSGAFVSLSPGFINNITAKNGVGAPGQKVFITGRNLTAAVVVTAISGSRISSDSSSWSTTTLTFSQSGGNVNAYFFVSTSTSASNGHYTGNIIATSTGATSATPLPVDITISSSNPTITRSPTTIDLGTTLVNDPGDPVSVSVTGTNLVTGIGITAGGGTDVSCDNGITFGSNCTLLQAGGSFNGSFSARLSSAGSAGSPSGTIGIASGSASTTVSYSGSVTAAPGPGGLDTVVFLANFSQLAKNVPPYYNIHGNPNCWLDSTWTDPRYRNNVSLTICPGRWGGGGTTDNNAGNGCSPNGPHASSDILGISNSLIVDPDVSSRMFFNFVTGTFLGQTLTDTNEIITGLDPNELYSIWFYAADGQTLGAGHRYMTMYCYDSTNFRADSVGGWTTVMGGYDSYHNINDTIYFKNKRPSADGKIRLGAWPIHGGNSSNSYQYFEQNAAKVTKQGTRLGMEWVISLGLFLGLFRKRKRGMMIGLLSLASVVGFGQSEQACLPAYDSSFTMLGINGGQNNHYRILISRHADNLLYDGIICIPGDGELGPAAMADTTKSNLQAYMYHYWIRNGWDGGIQLGNGKHYPNVITIIYNANGGSNLYGVYGQQLLDSLKRIYHMRSLSIIGLSKGSEQAMRFVMYQSSANDYHAMDLINDVVCLQGSSGALDGINKTTGYAAMGTWALRGGKYFSLIGSADGIGQTAPAKQMNDTLAAHGLPRLAFAEVENYNGGTHCCWNEFCNPSRTNFLTWGFKVSNGTEQIFNYSEPASVWQWMLRQLPDTSLVGGGAPTVSAGSNQSINLPTTTATLTATASGNNGHTISSYAWSKISGPTGGAITSPTSSTTGLTGLIAGVYVYQVLVTDNAANTNTSTVTVTVVPLQPPTVFAGVDQSIADPVTSTTLVGSAAGNGGATISTYSWTQRSGPNTATIGSASTATTSLTGLITGQYVFRLTVVDNNGSGNSDDIIVNVSSTPPNPSPKTIPITVGEGEYQVFFIDQTGHAWGNGNANNIGAGPGATDGLPHKIKLDTSFRYKFVCGSLHGGYVVTDDATDTGHIYGMASDFKQGQAGDGNLYPVPIYTPIRINYDADGNKFDSIDQVIAGYAGGGNGASMTYALRKGDAYVWGWTKAGMKANGTLGDTTYFPTKIIIPGNRKVLQLLAGTVLMILCTDGTVWTCGGGTFDGLAGTYAAPGLTSGYYDLGYVPGNPNTDYLSLHQLSQLSNIIQIAGGKSFNYALRADGKLFRWGKRGYYQAGVNNYPVPTDATADITSKLSAPIAQIVTNYQCTNVICTDGTRWAWGEQFSGFVGNGVQLDYPTYLTPWMAPGGEGILPLTTPVKITNKSNAHGNGWIAVFGSSVFTGYTYAEDVFGQMFVNGDNKGGSILSTQTLSPKADINASYRPSWNRPWATPIPKDSLFGATTFYLTTSPGCVIIPPAGSSVLSGSPCSEYVVPANIAPVARAGSDISITTDTAVLDGTTSTDNVFIQQYLWTQISGPAAQIEVNAAAKTVVRGLQQGVSVFQLTVTDNGWYSSTSIKTITVGISTITPCECLQNPDNKKGLP